MHDRATTVGLCSITRPIQGQGHEALKVGNPSIFKSYLLRHLQWELATDHSFLLNLIGPDFWYSSYTSFCAAWLWPWQKRQLWRVDRQSGANFYSIPVYFHLDWQWKSACAFFHSYSFNVKCCQNATLQSNKSKQQTDAMNNEIAIFFLDSFLNTQ